jgi:hypothetical protein
MCVNTLHKETKIRDQNIQTLIPTTYKISDTFMNQKKLESNMQLMVTITSSISIYKGIWHNIVLIYSVTSLSLTTLQQK